MAAHSTQQAPSWLPQLPPSAPLAGKEASSLGMAAGVLDANDNASDAAPPDKERAIRPYAELAVSVESGAHQSQHNNQPSCSSGQVMALNQNHLPPNANHTQIPHYLSHPQDSHHHHHHHLSSHANHNPVQQKPAAYEASDASTPSRTRSTSSSNFTPLSTFPSSTSRAHALIGDVDAISGRENARDPTPDIDSIHTPLNTTGRPEHVHVADSIVNNNGYSSGHDDHDNDNNDNDSNTAPSHVPFAQLHPFYLYPSSHQQQEDFQEQQQDSAFLSAPSPQPHSLLASPQLCIRSRSRRSGRTGASSHSRSRNDSHSRRPSLEEARARDKKTADTTAERVRAHDVTTDQDRIDTGVDNDGESNHDDNEGDNEDAESLDSHALAWDQTCLRIAYLVSTMVTPSANASVGGGAVDAGAHATDSTLAMARSSSPGPTGANGTSGTRVANGDAGSSESAAWQLLPEMLDHFIELCTKGWAGSEPRKKRNKIAQMLYWQNEVAAYGTAAYCGCADGSPIPDDSLITNASEPPSLQSASTNTSSSATASTSAGASMTSVPASASASGDEAPAATECAMCGRCGFTLTPKRPIVWVADPKDGTDEIIFKKVRRQQESPGDSIRKAFKSIRGLVFSKKNKRSASSPAGMTAASTHPQPTQSPSTPLSSPLSSSTPVHDKATMARRAWSQWEELNCQRLRDESNESRAKFFPQTTMYSVRMENEDAPKPASVGEGKPAPGSMSPSATQAQAKDQVPVVVGDDKNILGGAYDDDEDDDEDDEEYDPDHDDASQILDDKNLAAEQRRQRETNARLRRAEKLLKKTNDAVTATAQVA